MEISNFKSANSKIKDIDNIKKYFKYVLKHQDKLKSVTFDTEINDWKPGELDDFQLDPEKIDRLYYINKEVTNEFFYFEQYYELIVRINYNDQPLYVDMWVVCNFCESPNPDDPFPNGRCIKFVSKNVILFMKMMFEMLDDYEEMYELLLNDGVEEKKLKQKVSNMAKEEVAAYNAAFNKYKY